MPALPAVDLPAKNQILEKMRLANDSFMKKWPDPGKEIVTDALHPNGFLGFVQGTGKQPSEGQPVTFDHAPDFEDFTLGGFLLAGSELYRLAASAK